MKEVIQHPIYGEIVFDENFWSGKKTLTVNGVIASAVSKKEYMIDDKKAFLKGSFLTGSTLNIEGEVIQLSPKPTWYEIVISALSFLFLMTWGNSETLCAIFPVVGGAIGGGLGGVGAIVSLLLTKTQKTPLAKIIVGIVVSAATVFIAYLLAIAIILMLA